LLKSVLERTTLKYLPDGFSCEADFSLSELEA
jgi:hypothetical protein